MNLWVRIALYVVAGAMGISGAAFGLSKGVTLLLIAAFAYPAVIMEARYRRSHGENRNA